MVTISNYFIRENKEGKTFVALELTGDLEMIQSSQSGRFYASAKRCTISSVFSEEVAKHLIGKQMPGKIEREETEPYEYTVKETGEVIMLTHTYVYVPDEKQHAIGVQPSGVLMGT
jgi:hypothetical protein